MNADELAFREEMLDNAELLDCASCADTTLHTHEEVLRKSETVTELRMWCTRCMSCRTWLTSS
ncbi:MULTISPECIES: hypothetical protein [Hymenobacter]|uniref:hypothetical protein n=1 Tax=Hymenobacter TaxID=89966 RepID=UPI0010586123|nr:MULTISPECIES: hypothetical protein [Hymenobacter]QIL78254.1 hypothetical protein G7064_20730 [Hymenobacter sp. HDW8]